MNLSDRQTYSHQQNREQEHVTNSPWLMPLSNPTCCQSLLTQGALSPLPLVRMWPCCALLQSTRDSHPEAIEQDRALCVCVCVRVLEEKNGGNYMERGCSRRRGHGHRPGRPTFMCARSGTENKHGCEHRLKPHHTRLCFDAREPAGDATAGGRDPVGVGASSIRAGSVLHRRGAGLHWTSSDRPNYFYLVAVNRWDQWCVCVVSDSICVLSSFKSFFRIDPFNQLDCSHAE